jgi:hypothetical protein
VSDERTVVYAEICPFCGKKMDTTTPACDHDGVAVLPEFMRPQPTPWLREDVKYSTIVLPKKRKQ